MNILQETLGWIGSACVLIAYFLNMRGKLRSDARTYIWLNLAGSLFLVMHTYIHGAIPSMVVNIVWAMVAIPALLRKK